MHASPTVTSGPAGDLLGPGRGLLVPLGAFTAGAATVAHLAGGRVGAGDLAVLVLVSCLAWPLAAAALRESRPGHPLGAVLWVPGVLPLLGALVAAPRTGARPMPADVLAAAALPGAVLACTGLVAVPVVLASLAVPSGSLRPRATVAPAVLAATALAAAALGVPPDRPAATALVPAAWSRPAAVVATVALAAAVLAAHLLVARARRLATGAERDRLGWYLLGAALAAPTGWVLAIAVDDGAPAVVTYALAAVVAAHPVAVAVLAGTDRVPALDLALARAAALAAVTVGLAAVYLGIVAGLAASGLPEGPLGAAVLTGTAALVAVPLWGRCRSAAEVLLFGAGRRPASVLAAMQRQVTGPQPAGSLAAVTRWVADAVRSPCVRVHVEPDGPAPTAAGGVSVPLAVGGVPVGWLEVAPRTSGERYGRRDVALLEQLAVPVALVVRVAAAHEELARSERRVLRERAAERRRVLDDLHDGLGPALAGAGLHLAVVRSRLARDADGDERIAQGLALLEPAIEAVAQVGAGMRRLVRDLEPGTAPGAGDGGLVDSAEELVRGWAGAGRAIGLTVGLRVRDVPDPLPDDVRLAAYRVLGEAVTNVVRHAGATRCTVALSGDRRPDGGGDLVLCVQDDGHGGAATWAGQPGTGLRSMRARAVALGGRLRVEEADGGGTVVTARFPLPPA
jgi:signal transduction histidine kinase